MLETIEKINKTNNIDRLRHIGPSDSEFTLCGLKRSIPPHTASMSTAEAKQYSTCPECSFKLESYE